MEREILGRQVMKERGEKAGRGRRARVGGPSVTPGAGAGVPPAWGAKLAQLSVTGGRGGNSAKRPASTPTVTVTPTPKPKPTAAKNPPAPNPGSNTTNLWQNGFWISSFPDESVHMNPHTDFSPGFALRKIAALFENRKWAECAELIQRLNVMTLRIVIPEVPVDLILDAFPASLPILESLYAKLYSPADPEAFPTAYLRPEALVGRVVRWLVKTHGDQAGKQTNSLEYYTPMVQRVLDIIIKVSPPIRDKIREKQRSLAACVEGLAAHGLVDTSEAKLTKLHEALKSELNRMVQQVRAAVQRLDDLNLAQRLQNSVSLSRTSTPSNASFSFSSSSTSTLAPSGVSHQRLMHVCQVRAPPSETRFAT